MNVGAKTARLFFLYRQFIDFLPRDSVTVRKKRPPLALTPPSVRLLRSDSPSGFVWRIPLEAMAVDKSWCGLT
jgi:hypothetical protein